MPFMTPNQQCQTTEGVLTMTILAHNVQQKLEQIVLNNRFAFDFQLIIEMRRTRC